MATRSWWYRNRPALIVGAVIFGAIGYFGTRDYLPKSRVVPEYLQRVEVTPQKPYELEWPRRKEKPEAPPMSLLIPHAEFGRWMSGERTEVEKLSTGHDRIYLFTSLPDNDALSAKAMGEWCPSGLESEDCNVAGIRILLMQDAPDRDEPGARVMDSEARGAEDATSGPHRKLKAFWVKEDRARSRLDFVGWDCPGEAPAGAVTTDTSKPLVERNRCFDPGDDAVRRAPTKAGYQRVVQLTLCSTRPGSCTIYFPFRGRYVEAAAMQSPMAAKSEDARATLFLASWEFVNRLHADSRVAPTPPVRLARASVSIDNCRAIAALIPKSRPSMGELDQYVRWQCGYGSLLAMTVNDQYPAEATTLVLDAQVASNRRMPGVDRHFLKAAVDALAAAPQRDPELLVRAQFALALELPATGSPTEGGLDRIAALREAVRLADALLPPGSDLWVRTYRQLDQSLDPKTEIDAKIAHLEHWLAGARKAIAPADVVITEPLLGLCWTLEGAERAEPLKACADQALPYWLGWTQKETGPALSDSTVRTGLNLLRWYSQYGIVMNRPREVLPTMRRMGAILEPRMHGVLWLTQGATAIKYVEDKIPISERTGQLK